MVGKLMGPSKILVIDDEIELCKPLKEFLEDEGYLVDCAHNGEEGINKVKQFLPDLVLLDIRMPKTDGYFFLENIKNLSKDKIIIISALHDPKTIEKCKNFGVKIFVSKPIDLMNTKTMIENALKSDPKTTL